MPAKYFLCPDNKTIPIASCLKDGGCRLKNRCATRPYLRLVGYDREWRGVSPSAAGNGPRLMYLKATIEYTINPLDRAWAAFGTSTHEVLGMHKYSDNVLSEEPLSDDEAKGIADLLEQSESGNGYVLTDYKTWGSYKVAKALGIKILKEDEPILDINGDPVLLKSGKNKGKPKTKIKRTVKHGKPDLTNETLQLNRYRIFFEKSGFHIDRMQIQALPRDGGTYIAESRGIDKKLYTIEIPRLLDENVLQYYRLLADEVEHGFKTGFVRKCNSLESWEGRRCKGYCEVAEACQLMDKEAV